MRFTLPYDGEVRYITKFALLPIRIRNEVRWLEKCHIKQIYNELVGLTCRGRWCNDEFLDPSTFKNKEKS